jgi:hypothetical protein
MPFQSYGPYSSASIDVKTGSPDPADFAKTRRLLPRLWHNAQSPLAYHACQILGILFPESPFSHFRNKYEQVLGNKISR